MNMIRNTEDLTIEPRERPQVGLTISKNLAVKLELF